MNQDESNQGNASLNESVALAAKLIEAIREAKVGKAIAMSALRAVTCHAECVGSIDDI